MMTLGIASLLCAAAFMILQPRQLLRLRTVQPAVDDTKHRIEHGLQYAQDHLGIMCAGIAVLLVWAYSNSLAIAIATTLLLLVIGIRIQAYHQQKVQHQRETIAMQALSVIEGELCAGASLAKALEAGAQHCQHAQLQALLRACAWRSATGAPHPAAELANSNIAGFAHLAHGLAIAQRHGISLAALTKEVRARVEAQQQHYRNVHAHLQAATVSSWILAALPLAGIGLGYGLGVDVLSFLSGTTLGAVILCAGLCLEALGLLWSHRIIVKAG